MIYVCTEVILSSDITYSYSLDEKERLSSVLNSFLREQKEYTKEKVLKRINQGEPYQYILNKTWFYQMDLMVNANVLIPRPETEELVDYIVKNCRFKQVLDLCTGSGCIALALKSSNPKASIKGVDVSSEALEVARINSQNLGLDINWIHDDVLEPIHSYEEYDLIVSNPPYIGVEEELSKTVKDFEPSIALISEGDALKFYKSILAFAEKHLISGGTLALEINQKYGQETLELFSDFDAKLLKDMSGNDRFILVKKY